jgi:hypothetical protein
MSADLSDPKLYGRAELAEKLGVAPFYVRRMIAVGFKMPLGKASVAMAHDFLTKNADLLAVANKPRGRTATRTPQAPTRPRPSASGK